MRLILTILLFLSFRANAQTYFVANSGNDFNDGLSPATAWKTIGKINSSSFNAGDSILLNKGDVWNEKLTIISYGTVGNPIIISSYGTGAKPVISGFVPVTGFTDSSNIWSSTLINGIDSLNTVLVNGKMQAKGRYPNSGQYLTYSSFTPTYITGTLNGTPDYTGSELVIRAARWLWDIVRVNSQSQDTLRFDSIARHNGATGYFFQNRKSFLDTLNEWCYVDSSKLFSIYAVDTPKVQVSNIDTLAYFNNKSYITVDGLKFTGANKGAVILDTCSHITIQNCTFDLNGRDAIYGKKSVKVTVLNDSISNCLNSAVNLLEKDFNHPDINTCDSAYVHGNYIKNIATLTGMGQTDEGKYVAVYTIGNGSEISNNKIDSIGYIPIYFNGYNTVVRNNIISNFCFIKDDGGGIYTIVSYLPVHDDGSKIIGNIISNGLTAKAGATNTAATEGVYLDVGTAYVTVDSNTISYCADAGIFFHISKYITSVRNNIIFNNGNYQIYYPQLEGLPQNMGVVGNVLGNTINSNFLVSLYGGFNTIYFGVSDSNYYCSQYYPNKVFTYAAVPYTLSQWQTTTSLDIHSNLIPSLADLTVSAQLLVNDTPQDSTFYFTGTKIDAKGGIYNSVTIPPYSSKLVFNSIRYITKKLTGLKFRKIIHQ